MSSFCQTLFKVLEISKKTPLTSPEGFKSNDLWISWFTNSSCATQKLPRIKPDWQSVSKLL